jgi:NAD(P)-dependent dehydrogenase (short-subunit alcohol dehydrogenase family)
LNASITSSKGSEKFSVYNATKAAVRSFARSWTNDLKARKIRVNAISPGPIETPAMEGLTNTKELFGLWAVGRGFAGRCVSTTSSSKAKVG